MKSTIMTRRAVLEAASALGVSAVLAKPAKAAAEFDFKLGVNTPKPIP